MAFALGGPAVWPWYLCWGLVLLAAWSPRNALTRCVGAILVGSFLVKPNGILALPLGSSPVISPRYWIAAGALAWYTWTRGDHRIRAAELKDGLGPKRSVLAEP